MCSQKSVVGLGNSDLGARVRGVEVRLRRKGWSFVRSGLAFQLRQVLLWLWSHSGPLFLEVPAVLQAVHAPGQCD